MENRCVCCGDVIPEGRMVCEECEIDAEEKVILKRTLQNAAFKTLNVPRHHRFGFLNFLFR